jgi:flagellar biosynthesis/type III secretory pathway protein FliH
MARIIKGSGDFSQREVVFSESSRVIDKEAYDAHLFAREIIAEGETRLASKLNDAKIHAAQVDEEAALEGLEQAHSEAAHDVIAAFIERRRRILCARPELLALSLEIVNKILGAPLHLNTDQQDGVISEAIKELHAARTLRIEYANGGIDAWSRLALEFGIEVKDVCDVQAGQVRLISDCGVLLCSESAVAFALQSSLANE